MAPPRKEHNMNLPRRCSWHSGTIYYIVPTGQEAKWANRKRYALADNIEGAIKVLKERGVYEACDPDKSQ